jgi:glycosyltransferase involved in cell wall biosynthesis
MKIYLVGNYPPDKQESMNRFGEWLKKAIRNRGWQVIDTRPRQLIGYLAFGSPFLQKWLGYVDKFFLYPLWLLCLSRCHRSSVFHIIDHSNASYSAFVPRKNCVLTCHDVLAIRGGLGDKEAFCPASRFGTYFQKWILRHLQRSPHIVFVSRSTQSDYLNLPNPKPTLQSLEVIHNGLNATFDTSELEPIQTTYFFHIGSQLPRKNRVGILNAFARFYQSHKHFQMWFAGRSFSDDETTTLHSLGLPDGVVVHQGKVSHERLIQLYRHAQALVFPSFSEGFGWPVIEAQALSCPVICSNLTSLPEIAGQAALICDPHDMVSLQNAMEQVLEPGVRERLINAGLANIQRFSDRETAQKYLTLYEKKCSQ